MKRIQNEQWLDALPEEAVKVAEEINIDIARVIAERIKNIGELKPTDIKKLTNAVEFLGADMKKITKLIEKHSKSGKKAVEDAFKQAADGSDEFAQLFYAAKGLSARSRHNDTYLHRLVNAMIRQTGAQFTNLSQTLAFKINERTISLRQMYTRAIDKAIYEVQSGTLDYHTAMRKTVRELAEGLRVQNSRLVIDEETGELKLHWESGHSRRLDSHVRQNMIDGVKQLQSQMLDYHGDRFGADGVELSAHAICAPDHLAVQGRQFSNDEFEKMQRGFGFEDVNGNQYNGFARPIGQWNCRHVKFPIIIGISQPAHTEEQLEQYAQNSRDKYDLTQKQRAMETKLRSLKNQRLAASAAGDELEAKRIQRRINVQQKAYREFSAKNNLLYDTRRASVEGYRRISIKGLTMEDINGNIEMYRKGRTHRKTSAQNTSIIDKPTYYKITNPIVKQGADIRIAEGEWAERLEAAQSTAVTIGDVIYFREDATVSDVLEETRHFIQNKIGLNNQYGNIQREIMNEIDAKEYVLSMTEKYHIPEVEVELTKEQLKNYKEQMKELQERGEWDD